MSKRVSEVVHEESEVKKELHVEAPCSHQKRRKQQFNIRNDDSIITSCNTYEVGYADSVLQDNLTNDRTIPQAQNRRKQQFVNLKIDDSIITSSDINEVGFMRSALQKKSINRPTITNDTLLTNHRIKIRRSDDQTVAVNYYYPSHTNVPLSEYTYSELTNENGCQSVPAGLEKGKNHKNDLNSSLYPLSLQLSSHDHQYSQKSKTTSKKTPSSQFSDHNYCRGPNFPPNNITFCKTSSFQSSEFHDDNNRHPQSNSAATNELSTITLFQNDARMSSRRSISAHADDFDETNFSEHYLHSMDVLCVHCKAKHFSAEKVANKGKSFNDCCSHGKVVLDLLRDPPPILKQLFDGTHEKSNHFYEHIRYYNNSFSFASFNANLVRFNNRRPGPFCFKIQGQIYYQINTSLYPANDEMPNYGQLFIVDPDEAMSYRLNSNSHLNGEVLSIIDSVMRQHNVFAQSYQMMKEELDSMTAKNNGTEPELQLLFTLKKGQDRRRYNFQRVNEVAAVFSTTADGDIPESYVTIRNRTTKDLQYVSSMNENVEPWTYPLFYPYGTKGWHDGITLVNSSRRVTRNAYIKYRMAIREDTNYILLGRRLFQQWTVDNYVKMEKDRMTYLRNNQKQLRADSYESLIDHLQNRANGTQSHIGRVVILPSTHQGSPRNMLQTYQDAMTIVREFGKPDLFITMTSNPKWKEITENLLSGQTASDRPDLIARVFEQKKEELINIITKENLFGRVQAYVYVIEYQKRGLPHVHLLLTLKQDSKITTPTIVDKHISAEIPDLDRSPRLHEIIKNNMIHGPCGDWCLDEKGNCSKKFPKSFKDETTMDEDGYPHYRRRDTRTYTRRDGFVFDNQHVVPHNKVLLLRLNCHINVEIVSSIKAVKYLYKYIYKGHDAAAVMILESDSNENRVLEHDEIRNYVETRYVCPSEACARILNFSLHGRSHSVTRLPIHLPNQQTIMIDNIDNEDAIRSALNKESMLTEYFALNERDSQAKQFTYSEIPNQYVFKKLKGASFSTWEPRKSQFNVLGRMYSISPTQTELFHLRLLLTCVKGATSYENLRTVNGVIHENFISTCLALGLIEDDDEWKNAMHEAEIWMMPRQLRQLFIRILLHCHPIHPEELWEEFKDALSQDFSRTMPTHQAHRKAYIQINTLLNDERSSLAAFPSMPQITEIEDIDNEILPEQHRAIGTNQYEKLNEKQKKIVETILKRIGNENSNESTCFFIDGPGGSGKTFTYTTLYHLLRSQENKVCAMAFTGIAATLLPHGKTVHKTFKLPIALYGDSSPTIKAQSKEAEYLRSVDVFIWDEAPMAPRHALELVDRIMRDIMNNKKPFGGKIFVLGGDFRQLLPVKKNATRSELVNLSIKFSPLWSCFSQFSLTENMRTLSVESDFAKYLLTVGDGDANINDSDLSLPETCIALPNVDIAEDVYGDVIKSKQYDKLANWVILSARNVDVNDINERVVDLLDKSTERIYHSINTVKNCDNGEIGDALLPEFLETLNPPNLPPHKLRLRRNTVVMLIRNLSVNEGLCNGTRLLILDSSNHLLKCKILTGDKLGQIAFINRITLYSDDTYPFEFGRRQFPIKLAFAMTINKSQGQTFEKIGIDLRRDVFNHGQMYVALSRVRSWNSLKVYLGDQRESNIVKNHVYTELYS